MGQPFISIRRRLAWSALVACLALPVSSYGREADFLDALAAKYRISRYEVADRICDETLNLPDPDDNAEAHSVASRFAACLSRSNMDHDKREAATTKVPGQPGRVDILNVLASSGIKYFGGSLTNLPGEQAMPSPFGGIMYKMQRYVEYIGCNALSSNTYRCNYRYTKSQYAEEDSSYGKFVVAYMNAFQNTPGAMVSNDFVRTKTGWTSPTVDQSNRRSAAAYSSRPRSGSVTSHEFGPDQDWKDNQQRMQNEMDMYQYLNN